MATPTGRALFPPIWEAATVFAGSHLLAHQGGWDEALMVVVPVGVFASLVWVAYRRSDDSDGNGPSAT